MRGERNDSCCRLGHRFCFWSIGDGRLVFFFFQAEDGIRDLTVTGVQTCALPIFATYFSVARISFRSAPVRVASGLALATASATGLGRSFTSSGTGRRMIVPSDRTDRKSVVEGKSVGLGGRRIIKKKKDSRRSNRP